VPDICYFIWNVGGAFGISFRWCSALLGHKPGRCDCLEQEDLGCGVIQLKGGTKLQEAIELFFFLH